jgi:hypothetical protein
MNTAELDDQSQIAGAAPPVLRLPRTFEPNSFGVGGD